MRRSRFAAFTLIEVLIVLAVILAVTVPVLDYFTQTSRSYHEAIRFNDLKAETDRIGFRVVGLLRSTPSFVVGEDNRHVTWGSRNSLHWDTKNLSLQLDGRGHMLSTAVTHFSLLRRNGETQLTLECTDEATGRRNRRRYQIEVPRD